MWITFNRFSSVFEVFVPQFYLHYTYCIVPECLLNHPNSFCRAVFKLNATLMQICCSPHSVIFNAAATQNTCSLNSLCHPHCRSEVVIVHACAFQSTFLDCQVTLMLANPCFIFTVAGFFSGQTLYLYLCLITVLTAQWK